MHHSDIDFWRHIQSLPPNDEDLPSPRVCRLLLRTFEKWKGRSAWLNEKQVGHLFRERSDIDDGTALEIAEKPVGVRKALAIKQMLELVMNRTNAANSDTSSVLFDELIVGTMPPFSVGQGKEFVRYLTEEEELYGALEYLNELSPMGHIVPNYSAVLEFGLEKMIADARDRGNEEDITQEQSNFYKSVEIALGAVIDFSDAYSDMVLQLAKGLDASDPNQQSLSGVANNLSVAPRLPAKTFHQALQAIFIVHCALHWTVEIVPLGRLDQLLQPYYEHDLKSGILTPEAAQELIECFWIKLDERVILDFRHAENRFTAADGVLTGFWGASNYDQGCLLNQWMQQVTIGGQIPNDSEEPVDACNDVTRMCLIAARRLPLNSPTLDLRVHKNTPADVLQLAARALMSGGAHPVLLNDDIIVTALSENSGHPIPIAAARNYACDGCYETMIAGESEFSFGFVSALDLIEKTMNRGAGLAASGAIHLRGFKDSWRSKPCTEIVDFDEFLTILRSHMLLSCHRYFRNLLTFYGNKAPIAPSPLLSALILGCMESGRDLSNGGARYHIFSPLLVGVSSAADSLYAIKELVYENNEFSLSELLSCLATDWGNRIALINNTEKVLFGASISKERATHIRQRCMSLPKFGAGHHEVDALAWSLMESFAACVKETHDHPMHSDQLKQVQDKFGSPNRPFHFNLTPGVGTFEQYVYSGSFCGASADGRRANGPIASDLSPAPLPHDVPPRDKENGKHSRVFDLATSLNSYRANVMAHLGDGAPVDYNLPEDFPVEKLAGFLQKFADGEGGSICTFTVGDPKTFEEAQKNPEKYNLVRVRMGGWTEFFVALFPDHQEQHKRRPLYV